MKYILATLVALANATSIQHHEGTFYEEYNVGGHSHERTEGPHRDTEPIGGPVRPLPPNIYEDDEEVDDQDGVNQIYGNKASSSHSSSSSRSSSQKTSKSSSSHTSSQSQLKSAFGDFYDSGAEQKYDEQDDEENVHVSPKPTLTYSTSSHNTEDHHDHGVGDDHDHDLVKGDFHDQVHEFDTCDEIWNQDDYEERLETEAELMVALEAIREALVQLDSDIVDLEDCIDENSGTITTNYGYISVNDLAIIQNESEIESQQLRLEALQWRCADCQERLDDDRALLVLYCQQFAFAVDMVGPCADILTCSGTQLDYRWDQWTQQ